MRCGRKGRAFHTTTADPWGTLEALKTPQMFDSVHFQYHFYNKTVIQNTYRLAIMLPNF